MSEIYHNYKPIIENHKTVWVPDTCECGEDRVIVHGNSKIECLNCGKEIHRSR